MKCIHGFNKQDCQECWTIETRRATGLARDLQAFARNIRQPEEPIDYKKLAKTLELAAEKLQQKT